MDCTPPAGSRHGCHGSSPARAHGGLQVAQRRPSRRRRGLGDRHGDHLPQWACARGQCPHGGGCTAGTGKHYTRVVTRLSVIGVRPGPGGPGRGPRRPGDSDTVAINLKSRVDPRACRHRRGQVILQFCMSRQKGTSCGPGLGPRHGSIKFKSFQLVTPGCANRCPRVTAWSSESTRAA